MCVNVCESECMCVSVSVCVIEFESECVCLCVYSCLIYLANKTHLFYTALCHVLPSWLHCISAHYLMNGAFFI